MTFYAESRDAVLSLRVSKNIYLLRATGGVLSYKTRTSLADIYTVSHRAKSV